MRRTRPSYFTTGAAGAGAVTAGGAVVNSFIAFCTVLFSPHPAGATTTNHASTINAGDDFFICSAI